MLKGRNGGVFLLALQGEMVEQGARAEVSVSLGDELRAHHGLAIPGGGIINANADALLIALVGRVLEVCADFKVVGGGLGAVDVPLVWADWVRPRP